MIAMKLDRQTLQLIAVGASVAANCQPCLEHNVGKALEHGADSQQIADAIDVGRRVRQGAGAKFDQFAASLNDAAPAPAASAQGGCCG
jgi:AhpD family alkylhydroperoxidase